MTWTKNQLEFLENHPEVFEEAEDPSKLFDRIRSFDECHWNDGDELGLVLGWVEARKFGVAFTGRILNLASGRKRMKIFLKGPIVNEELLILVIEVYDNFTQEQLFEVIKSRFNSEYLFPLSDLPFIYNGIKNLIMG